MFKKYLKLFFIILGIFGANLTLAKEIVVKDVLDREVKLNLPAKRIALGFYYTDFLAVGGVKALDKVVGFSKAVWTDWTPASWELYSKTLPQLNSIADFGEVEVGTFSVEKVLSLKPDLLILAAWQYQVLEFDLEPIIEANIPIIVLDYNKEKVELHAKSTELLGVITGEEKRAKELIDFYKNTANEVTNRIEKAQLPKPKIYIEFGNKGPNETGFTYGKDMWGALIDLAGGENIATPFVKQWAPINPEQVIVSKPDVIMIAGRETELKKNQEAMVMGFNIDEKEALKRLEAYKNRPGWSALPAIKDNKLYGLYMGASRTLADAAMIQYIAKALYPSLFEDIDPIQTYINFHKNYLPVIPKGTFGVQAK
ncbi:ABC transporter substrate-binding protein [Campylobacter jejuni]|uniref:ABC transporter substrate-binding protein n=1 Tax=Campylobacter jejuni TaxID=197 RepID=UPI0007743409|nr:ABC transporter substrate-binding protein [Campylobacter jejuni]EAH4639889.1 iron ABC transporter substrate-binding protein [Campylobacter jejuni]EAH5333102.1 iron ABC transporter substrate-binding protein [Campylobacter jejuni]EAH7148733.1 iron ABC transporter substrate-binding protein [Campylobacter jejuni]EAH9306964.1 iron ABC transporter substrate-binding protein [Campylobacter jejuni]EAJ0168860.1 iron ABC transporter substrate-binding protein [Campylobacter jejuni]